MNYTARQIRPGAVADTKIEGIGNRRCWVSAHSVVKRRLFARHFELIAPARMIGGVAARLELNLKKL